MPLLACPFCNASLAGLTKPDAEGRVLCPRCAEPLPANVVSQLDVAAVNASGETAEDLAVQGSRRGVVLLLQGILT